MESPDPMKSLPRSVLVVLAAGLLLRLLVVVFNDRPLISDEREYDLLAFNLASTGVFGYGETPTAYRPFGYPAFVAAWYALIGHSPFVVKMIQAFLDPLVAVLLYLLLAGQSGRARFLGAAIWSAYIPAMLYVNLLLSETIFVFLLVLTALVVARSGLERSIDGFRVGLLLGLLVLLKPGMILFVVMVAGALSLSRVPLVRYPYIVLGVLLILLPWVFRNAAVMGKPTIGTNGGINLLIGNNPNATGGYALTFPEDLLRNASSEVEADEIAYREAIQFIVDHPPSFVVNAFKKLGHLFSSEGGLLVWSFHAAPEGSTERFSSKYASLPILLVLVVNLMYATVLLVGIVGFIGAERDLLWWFVFALIACWLITHAVFFGGSRFHFPLMPFFALYAAPILPNPLHSLEALPRSARILFFVLTAGFFTIWTVEFYVVATAS
jgi:hypothetical protein